MFKNLPKKHISILFVLFTLASGLIFFELPTKPHSKFSTSYEEFEKGKLPKAAPTDFPESTVEVAGTIYSFDIDDDNTMIALATSKGVVIYDMASLKLITELPIANGVQTVSFSSDGKKLAILQKNTLAYDFGYIYVMVFETGTWQSLYAYQNESANYLYAVPNQIAWNPDNMRLAFGTPDNGVVIWNPENNGEIQAVPDFTYSFGRFDWSTDGTRLIFNEQGYGLRRLHVDTNDWVRLYDPESQAASNIEWSPNGKYIASGHYGGTVCIWNASNNQCEGFIRAHFSSVDGLAWSPDSKQIATSSGAIRIWDAKTGEEKSAFGYAENINYTQLEWVKEQTVATLETSYIQNISPTIKFWDINTGDVKVAFRGWQEMKSANYDGLSLRIDDIQISEKETLIQTSLLFDYQNTLVLDWNVRLKDDRGKTYPLTRVYDTGFDSNLYHFYRTIPLPKDRTFTLEIKSPAKLELTRDISNEYGVFYFDPSQLKLGESVEMNQEIYASEFVFYLTEAEKISSNQIRFEFFTSYPISSVWLDSPYIIGNTISEDGKGRFSATLTFSKIPNDFFELLVQKVNYKAQGPWILEFDVFDSMWVK